MDLILTDESLMKIRIYVVSNYLLTNYIYYVKDIWQLFVLLL